MTEQTPEPEGRTVGEAESDSPAPGQFDFTTVTPEPIPEFTPNHKASREGRGARLRAFGRKTPVGDQADGPPSRTRRAAAKKAPAYRKGMFVAPLTQVYTGVGIMLLPFDPVCANAVMVNAENCAKSLDELAKNNEAVRRALASLITTTAWGAVLIAHLPILMAVAMHHVPAAQNALGVLGAGMAEQIQEQMKRAAEDATGPEEGTE